MRPYSKCSIRPRLSAELLAAVVLVVAAIAALPARAEIRPEPPQSAENQSSESPFAILEVQVDEEAGTTQVVPASVEIATGEAPSEVNADDAARIAKATATHHQTGVVGVNVEGQPKVSLKCFCLTADDRILAGCVGPTSEIRVFDADGNYLESWSAPFQPDAIFARADGTVFLAGEGKLAKLSADGAVELERESPHAADMGANREAIREQVIAQAKQRTQMYAQQTENYDQMLKQIDKQLAEVKKQIAELDQAAEAAAEEGGSDEQNESVGLTSERRSAVKNQMLERRLAMQQRMKEQYEQSKKQWVAMAEQNKQPELTEEQIERQIESSIQYKLKASSISAREAEVYLATHAAVGYGFDVWRMDDHFTGGEKIITGLSGCCGQMDVKANDDGLFVAENSRHRVCRYDRGGKMIGN